MAKRMIRRSAKPIGKTRKATGGESEDIFEPSENPATKLLLADVTLRAGSYILRYSVEKGILRGRYGKEGARDIVKHKTLGTSLLSFALARIATRNLPGAILVGGGAIAKTLYDRRKSRKQAQRAGDRRAIEQARGD